MDNAYDVVVVGGGPAGFSGALALARSLRSVLVVDAGEPRNAPAAHLHNYLGFDGRPPADLLAAGRAELAAYGVPVVAGSVTSAWPQGDGFTVGLGDGTTVSARRLLLATGLVDELPDVPGLPERWGRDVLHCPYCHGYEARGRAIGVLATGPMAAHQAQLFRQLSPHVTVFLHDSPEPGPEQRLELGARGIAMVEGRVSGLEVVGDRLTGVRLASGTVVPVEALVVAPRFVGGSPLLDSLGLPAVPVEMNGQPFGDAVPADPGGATVVPGVWVAGNVTDLGAQLIGAAAAGLKAGAMINADLVAADTQAALAALASMRAWHQHDHTRVFDANFWEERYRAPGAIWSGQPNAVLAAEVGDLVPRTALDVGSGEGGDALWLAERGWQVTGVDFAAAALARAAARAETAGLTECMEWVHADVTVWTPPPRRFDLVSAHFLHMPHEQLRPLLGRLADAVAPGGTLLLVGHHPRDRATTMPRPDLPVFFTAEEVAVTLDPGQWAIEIVEARPRPAVDPEGHGVTIHDAVLRARRRDSVRSDDRQHVA